MLARMTIESASVVATAPRMSNVVAALRPFGFRNAGTPFAIASTPVSVAHPEANARSSRKAKASPDNPAMNGSSGMSSRSAVGASGRPPPRNSRKKPHAAMASIETMKR